MGTTITLQATGVTLVITGDRPYEGCTYNRLDGWYGVQGVDVPATARENAVGAFSPTQTYPGAKAISIEGDFFGADAAAALRMKEDLAALYNEGRPLTMTVADDLRTTSRQVLAASVDFPWTIHREFPYALDFVAPDPRRYGPEVAVGTGLAAAGTGLSYPLVYPLDYGTVAVNNRVNVSNSGNTETMSRYVVSGGDMPDGFEIVNVATGERLTYVGPVAAGNTVTIDTSTRTAFINATGQGSRYLSNPQWWTVPPRSTLELAFSSRGSISGSPQLDVYTAPAFY